MHRFLPSFYPWCFPLPRRSDLESILVLGSGPIIIGQACEFDYSGTQAVRALKEEGYRVVLVNSNPATIMTDPDLADRTYIEPLTPDWVERVIEREKPDGILLSFARPLTQFILAIIARRPTNDPLNAWPTM